MDVECPRMASGRVAAIYVPEVNPTLPPLTNEGDYVSEVLQVSGNSSLEFNVPYISDDFYKLVATPFNTSPFYNEANTAGTVAIVVVNSLSATEASGSVTHADINIWMAPGEDMQFAIPNYKFYYNPQTAVPAALKPKRIEDKPAEKFVGHSGKAENVDSVMSPPAAVTGSETIQLTTFIEAPPVSEVPIEDSSRLPADPYPDQGVGQRLSRVYKIANIAWTGAMTKGAQITAMSFPGKLFDEPAIQAVLSNFTYFECDSIHIECRCNSNMANKGTCLVPWQPHWLFDPGVTRWIAGQVTNTSLAVASMSPHVLIKASSNETVSFDIPMVTPKQLFKLSDVATMLGYFGAFEVYVQNVLAAVNGGTSIPTCEISFYANFVNPRPSGLTYASPIAGLLPPPAGEPRKVKYDPEEGMEKAKGHSGPPSASMRDRFKKSFKPIGGGKSIICDVIAPETIVSLRDLLHRYQFCGVVTGNDSSVTNITFGQDSSYNAVTKTTYNAITQLAQIFRFRRGGWSLLLQFPLTAHCKFELSVPDVYQIGDGSETMTARGVIDLYAFETVNQGVNIPWYSQYGFAGSPFFAQTGPGCLVTPQTNSAFFQAIGEDFSWNWIVGPMPHVALASDPDKIGHSKIGLDDEVDVIREIQRLNIRPKALPLRGKEFKGNANRSPAPRALKG
jgi:hypothetical protein